MTAIELRREIKKTVDRLSPQRLQSLADYVLILAKPPLKQRIANAKKAFAQGKGVNWRKVRSDV